MILTFNYLEKFFSSSGVIAQNLTNPAIAKKKLIWDFIFIPTVPVHQILYVKGIAACFGLNHFY